MKSHVKFKMMMAIVLVVVLSLSSVGFAKGVSEYDQYLINALKDKNIGVRASAAQLLGDRRVQEAIKPLIKMLKSEKDYACRIIAAKALYDIGDPKVLPLLKKVAKKDKNKTVRRVVTAIVQEMENVKLVKK